ncbi:MAG: SdiA-regulated domain-containing protein [Sphingobacterium sp.]
MMKNPTILTTMALGFASAIFLACNPNNTAKKNSSKDAHVQAEKPQQIPYTLSSGIKMNLPDELLEISGIAFLAGQDNDIYAIQDEQGFLYKFNQATQKVTFNPFGKDGDYEDISISNTHFFILKSNGSIYSFPIAEKDDIKNVVEQKNLLPKGEYEGLFVDRESNQAYVLCKECKVDRKQPQTSGYIFSIDENGQFQPKGEFAIQLDQLQAFDTKIKKTFKPAALAKKADSKEWYILSSVDKALVVTDENFRVKSLSSLNPKIFPQPEGINFDSKYNLYISSEAGNQDKGIIYKFEQK